MKISISWVFDHIDADWKKLDMARLAEQFIQTTSEIDRVYKVEIDTKNLFAGHIKSISDSLVVHCPELKKDFVLPKRNDATIDSWFLIKVEEGNARWVTLADVGSGKEGLFSEINKECPSSASGRTVKKNSSKEKISLADGSWKTAIQTTDYIFELDNKSINHRPDLWGHRGVAREIAAMLGYQLKPLESMLANFEVLQYENSCNTQDLPFSISIKDSKKCSRFAAFMMHDVQNRPSDLAIALRLARLDSRPIDAIVDATNYVMFDLGHPMHAFDAQKIGSDIIEVRDAKQGEKIKLLDGDEYELSQNDLVVAGKEPLGLAGIMGGASSAVSSQTNQLLLEAACFDATSIRKSAERAKKRTEASARFEKSLDPNNNVNALRRFACILDELQVSHISSKTLVSLGKPAVSPIISVEHGYIESRLGINLKSDDVVNALTKVEFGVEINPSTSSGRTEKENNSEISYNITVPTFRATKDIKAKEDIVEEVGRLHGYHNITPELPKLALKPSDMHAHTQIKKIKDALAFTGNMQEVASYNFFDEAFIQSIDWQPGDTLSVRSPVSQNWQRLVTTLVPNLFKGIQENCADYDHLRFFELARIYVPGKEISETKSLAGLIFEKKKELSFYDGKAVLQNLFERLDLDVTWEKLDPSIHPLFLSKLRALRANGEFESWFMKYQTAQIKHNDIVVGTAGMVPHAFLHKMSEGHAFVFELDADFLISYRAPIKRFEALPKFQPSVRDISLLLPASETVAEMSTLIASLDARIHDVTLVDYLTRKEFGDKRATTFRFIIRDDSKTLTKPEIDAIVQQVSDAVIARGAVIR